METPIGENAAQAWVEINVDKAQRNNEIDFFMPYCSENIGFGQGLNHLIHCRTAPILPM